MRRVSLFLSVLALTACGSSSEPAATPSDAGVDSGATDAMTDAKPPVDAPPIYPTITCGPGPYATFELQVIGQTIGAMSKPQPLLPINVSMSACPEVKGVTDGEGYAIVKMTTGVANSFRLDAPGWISTRWQETTIPAWGGEPLVTLMDKKSEAELPGFAADKGVILVDVAAASAGTCFSPDGVTLKAKDHPEAVITYHAASAPYAPVKDATGTTPSGLVSIAGIAPGTKVVLEGTKTGCDVVPYASPGGVLVEAGVISRAQMFVQQPLPTCGPPPWILLGGRTTTRETTGMAGTVVEGVNVSFGACPGVTATTTSEGLWQAWVSLNMPSTRRFEKDGFFTTLSSEQAWPQTYDKLDLAIRSKATWQPLMPGIDATRSYAIVGIAANKSGECAGPEGVSITVKDQPEAKVRYVDGEPPKEVAGATATTKRGLAYVSGLKPGELLASQLVGDRADCSWSLKGGLDSGNAKLEAGGITIVSLYPTKKP
jgi:hypothetical protein